MSNIQNVNVGDLSSPERPKAPWSKEEGFKRWEKSQHDGHRKLTLKCQQCGLEYAIFTLRDDPAEKLLDQFQHCPECGSVGSSAIIVLDHEIGRIYDAHSNAIVETNDDA